MKLWIAVCVFAVAVVGGTLWYSSHRVPQQETKSDAPVSDAPGLTAYNKKRLLDAYNEAVTAQEDFNQKRQMFTDLMLVVVDQSHFAKGTQFNVTTSNCKPDGQGVKCEQIVTPVFPEEKKPEPVNPEKK